MISDRLKVHTSQWTSIANLKHATSNWNSDFSLSITIFIYLFTSCFWEFSFFPTIDLMTTFLLQHNRKLSTHLCSSHRQFVWGVHNYTIANHLKSVQRFLSVMLMYVSVSILFSFDSYIYVITQGCKSRLSRKGISLR